MNLHNLKPAKGSTHKTKRIARGQGSGHGGTSTKGHKGDKSRSGHKTKRNFEGGQMPIQMRLPKRGFNSPNRVTYLPLNLSRLQEISEKYSLTEITPEALNQHGIIGKRDRIKVLNTGEMTAKLNVTAHAFSAAAKETIEGMGGSVNLVQ